MSDASGKKQRGCGCSGCLFAALAGGVGFVLLVMGFMPATTEALPFGAGLLVLGVVAAVPSAFFLLSGWAAKKDEPGAATAAASGAARPPASITCPACGGTAPLCLAEPSHSTCAFCRTRFELPPDVARRLTDGAAALARQSLAERQMEASVASLAQHQRAWTLRLGAVVVGLLALSSLVFLYGVLTRQSSDSWAGYFAFGGGASLGTVLLGLVAATLVPAAVRRVVGSWAAIRLPGEAGLGCRVCGGPLPATVAPVLRCSFCSADNLASSEVLRKVASSASAAERRMLAVAERRARGDELAARALRAFPLLVLLAWFAVGAASGSVVFVIADEVNVPADWGTRFAVIRTASGACLAAMETEDDHVNLYLGLDFSPKVSRVTRADFARYSVVEPVSASSLEGRQTSRGRIESVYRPLSHLGVHRGRVEGGTEIYLPTVLGHGEQICLTDVSAGTGAVLSPR